MHSFTGDFSRAKKISLAGKSQQAESRQQVLERTRQERDRRKQQKLETQSATVIQVRKIAVKHLNSGLKILYIDFLNIFIVF